MAAITIKSLANEIAKREGKKTQARIGEVREILGLLCDMIQEDESPLEGIFKVLFVNGQKRAKKKVKAK